MSSTQALNLRAPGWGRGGETYLSENVAKIVVCPPVSAQRRPSVPARILAPAAHGVDNAGMESQRQRIKVKPGDPANAFVRRLNPMSLGRSGCKRT